MSVNESYSRRIADALSWSIPADSVEGVKSAVIAEIAALDPKAKIKKTEYFNHSFIPDLVMDWPSDPSLKERYVYLRFNSNVEHLIDDVALIGDSQPIVFGLEDTPQDAGTELTSKLEESSREYGTLVTDALGLQVLISEQSSPFLKLVSSAIAQGGRGLLDHAGAQLASRALTNGMEGALRALEEPTQLAAQTLDTYLNHQQSEKVQGLLQAVWVASGGSLDRFPGRTALSDELNLEALQFIFEFDDIDDYEFWRRLGHRVALRRLAGLNLPAGSKNLEKFMHANLDGLWARSCRVKNEQDRLSEEEFASHWFTDTRFVGLKGNGYVAYLADKVDDLDAVKPDQSDGISIAGLTRRSSGIASSIDEAVLSNGHQTVKYYSDSLQILEDQSLYAFAKQLGEYATVRRVEVALAGGKHLSCDFTTATSSGRTKSKLSLPEILLNALPLLRGLTHDELAELRQKLAIDTTYENEQIGIDFNEDLPLLAIEPAEIDREPRSQDDR
ncbi:hypothetical protein [Lentzea sp. CA-135723]|uniref:hypothetical protein n=1 Tax=Lentzea sp. CA-135723 TaxID=3239950 RepID=UPI003D949C4A